MFMHPGFVDIALTTSPTPDDLPGWQAGCDAVTDSGSLQIEHLGAAAALRMASLRAGSRRLYRISDKLRATGVVPASASRSFVRPERAQRSPGASDLRSDRDCMGTLLLVATRGGHLVELLELAGRLPEGGRRLWVTFDSEQSRSLLAGEPSVFIPEIKERDVSGVLRALPHVRRIFAAERPVSAVVSTGSAIALAFLPYAAMRGVPAHYIESAARMVNPSLTGRLLSTVPGVQLYRQYAHCATGRWRYSGSVFDGFEPITVPERPLRRVVVTLGTMDQGFRRLLERLVAIIPRDTSVLWQTGATSTAGLKIEANPFVPAAVIEQAMREADVVVAHAGCGSALTALKAGKCPILIPRNPDDNEIVDAHQKELADWLETRGLARAVLVEALTADHLQRAALRAIRRTHRPPVFQLAANA